MSTSSIQYNNNSDILFMNIVEVRFKITKGKKLK